ncbi:hypothetical protein SAMN05444167_0949 [Terriglobus roseus]|uniref:Uncharacterized protein n=1 Tax=Terriglobus roseus TaxID=392734 RepID=A0A1G7H7P5_9BACT|nr:hypothetical protein SAMN05444167_0949 [Terriglobus roseus]
MEKWSINLLLSPLGVFSSLLGHPDYLAMIYPFRALCPCRRIHRSMERKIALGWEDWLLSYSRDGS